MFETISQGFQAVFDKIARRGRLTEDNIRDGIREVRTALLAADVNFQVVKKFTDAVVARAIGEQVVKNVDPGQQIVKIVYDELERLMGPVDNRIPLAPDGPTVLMMVGLQGSGKTTTCGKLARLLQKRGARPLLVAADVQRPAAVDQLEILGKQLDLPVYSDRTAKPLEICKKSIGFAKTQGRNVVVLDTAGRLHIDEELMNELESIRKATKPQQIYLVCDAMTGQDAVNSAKEFNDRLAVDGVILTKMEGDARGGAALSIKSITGKPIKFIGVGEGLDKLEEFHPDRMASRILGMGDIVGLVERAQESIDREEAEKLQRKLLKATFTLEDFLKNLQMAEKMGSMKEILGMIPGLGQKLDGVEIDEGEFRRIRGMIHSMTPEERTHPEIIGASRRRRIAKGSGCEPRDVANILKQFREMKKMMKDVGKGKIGALKKVFGGGSGLEGLVAEAMGAPVGGAGKSGPARGRKRKR
ncbi:MAG: signal recognition particle protein [Planctomycetes bacterium]|nr:signal recognition particle protein [Planctomycetota bacterium]